MRKALLGSVAAVAILVAAAGMARSADPTSVEEAVDWSGFYFGAHVGYGGANFEGCSGCTDTGGDIDLSVLNLNGVLGGVQAGFNMQMDSIVFGIEGDVSFMDWDDLSFGANDSSSSDVAAEVDLLASVRGRLGIAMDDVLLYATGGIAIPDAASTILDPTDELNVNFNDIGGVVGGGVEFAATDSLRLRAEGLYYFFGDKENLGTSVPSVNAGENFEFQDAFTARLGVNWYLN